MIRRLPRPGSLALITAIFAAAAFLRIWENGAPIAAALASTGPAAAGEADPVACPAQDAPEALLAAIRERQHGLESQDRAMAERAQVLAALEARAREQIEALTEAEAKLAATLAIADEAAEKDIARLTAVYENMKPKAAAGIFATMDETFAAGFLGRMRPDAAAEILANLPSDRAYVISLKIAGRNARAPVE
jgi:flagellar motility protein MotE (MotC chaperone)